MAESSKTARRALQLLAQGQLSIGFAESLTGGLLVARFVDVPGASRSVRGGVVAYQPAVKHSVLGVDIDLIESSGVVNHETARTMAVGALVRLGCDIAISTTGVAGPTAEDGKPVGTVFVGIAHRTPAKQESFSGSFLSRYYGSLGIFAGSRELRFEGERNQIRENTVESAILLLEEYLSGREANEN